MKTIIYISLILLIAGGFIGCKKILTVEQKMNIPNDMALTSVKDCEALLAGAYDGLQSGSVFGGNMTVYGDLLCDDSKVDEAGLGYFGTYEIYNRRTTVQISALRSMWSESYSTVNRVNNLIRVVDNNLLSGSDFTARKNRFKGESLALRAMVHFELMRFWALPYDVENQGGNLQPGIPYRTAATLSGYDDLAMARNTVEDVYNHIISDLKTADTLLSGTAASTPNRNRVTEDVAKAYLARVCFQKGDYIQAAYYADKVISGTGGRYALNDSVTCPNNKKDYLKVVFQTSGNTASKEVIFQLVNIESDQSNAISGSYNPSGGYPVITPAAVFKSLYNSKDIRRSAQRGYISADFFGNPTMVFKYATVNPAHNICIIRLAEMYLVKVESDIIQNSLSTQTYSLYNKIKKRAIRGYTTVLSPDNIPLDSIRIERRREMAFENDRYHNVKRMKQDIKSGIPWNDPSVLFKIPQEEMAGNPLMIQNP